MRNILLALLNTALVTLGLWLLRDQLTLANLSLVYLMIVVLTAMYLGTRASIFAALASFAAFNFFLIDPLYTFIVADTRELLDLCIFLIIAILTGQLAAQVKEQAIRIEIKEEANQLKTALLHAVSHDLRTPLTIIKTSAHNLLTIQDMPTGEREETLKSIVQETDHLNRMVGNLLDMSRLEAGALETHLALNSLEEVAGDVAAQIYNRLGEERVVLNFPDHFPLVSFDYGLLLQVLTNLVDNGLRYAYTGTKIEIRGTVHKDEVQLAVVNAGKNIPDTIKPHLTEPFYRGEGGRSGLGLAIARGIIEVHRGRLWIEDTPGGGATFIVALPYKDENHAKNSDRG